MILGCLSHPGLKIPHLSHQGKHSSKNISTDVRTNALRYLLFIVILVCKTIAFLTLNWWMLIRSEFKLTALCLFYSFFLSLYLSPLSVYLYFSLSLALSLACAFYISPFLFLSQYIIQSVVSLSKKL